MKSMKSAILISSLIIGIALLTISSRSQNNTNPIVIATASGTLVSTLSAPIAPIADKNECSFSFPKEPNPRATKAALTRTLSPIATASSKVSYTKLKLPDGMIVPVPKGFASPVLADITKPPYTEKHTTFDGLEYIRTYLPLWQKPSLKEDTERGANRYLRMSHAIDFYSHSKRLSPNQYIITDSCIGGEMKPTSNVRIESTNILLIEEDCGQLDFDGYDYVFDLGSKTIQFSTVMSNLEQKNYLESLIGEFIRLNQQDTDNSA